MAQTVDPQDHAAVSETPEQPAAPITSRFLFVDVAAQRAKQLRRGALARLDRPTSTAAAAPHKLERVAMEEVRNGLIHYTLPTPEEVQGKGART
jgi:DNA-directed RNA polymerase subunit K/omega